MSGSFPGERRGGRQKGVPNKVTAAKRAELAASGLLPLDYMLRTMRDPSADQARRDDMAKAAAPYLHPRLAAIEHMGKDGGPIQTEDVGAARDLIAGRISGMAGRLSGEIVEATKH